MNLRLICLFCSAFLSMLTPAMAQEVMPRYIDLSDSPILPSKRLMVLSEFDPDYERNQATLNARIPIAYGAYVTPVGDKQYRVQKLGSYRAEWYKNGRIVGVEFDYGSDQPIRTARYGYPSGKLEVVTIMGPDAARYVYSAKGDLIEIWRDGRCLSPENRSCNTRTVYVELPWEDSGTVRYPRGRT